MKECPATVSASVLPLCRSRAADFFDLTRPRITLLVLFTAAIAFIIGADGIVPLSLLSNALIGTALVAGAASAFNMYLERNLDALMRRTAGRPLPAGRLQKTDALAFALTISVSGMIFLFLFVNSLAGLLSAIAFLTYNFFYTPLKRRTWLCTIVGAVPGAIPALMGWAAATGALPASAWLLFAIVFFWQIPHFYAIGWIHREDYKRAGFRMLSVVDRSGNRTSRQSAFFIALLLPVALTPSIIGGAGLTYLLGALVLGVLFFTCAVHFVRLRDRLSARRLFAYSVFYLPALLTLLVADKAIH